MNNCKKNISFIVIGLLSILVFLGITAIFAWADLLPLWENMKDGNLTEVVNHISAVLTFTIYNLSAYILPAVILWLGYKTIQCFRNKEKVISIKDFFKIELSTFLFIKILFSITGLNYYINIFSRLDSFQI